MAHQRTGERTRIRLGQHLRVDERFLGLNAGQEVEIVGVSNETLVDGGRLEEVTLRLLEAEVACAPGEMTYHADDVRRALDQGKLAR
jgi:hypothetical protein